jgi:hypothetical protein
LTPPDPQLKGAWFQPSHLASENPVSKLCFQIQLVPLQRGIYSPETFERKQKYALGMLVTTDESLKVKGARRNSDRYSSLVLKRAAHHTTQMRA